MKNKFKKAIKLKRVPAQKKDEPAASKRKQLQK